MKSEIDCSAITIRCTQPCWRNPTEWRTLLSCRPNICECIFPDIEADHRRLDRTVHTCTFGNNKHRFFECASKQASQSASQPANQPACAPRSRETETGCGLVAIMRPLQYAPRYVHRSNSRKWHASQSAALCLLCHDPRYLNAIFAGRIYRSHHLHICRALAAFDNKRTGFKHSLSGSRVNGGVLNVL